MIIWNTADQQMSQRGKRWPRRRNEPQGSRAGTVGEMVMLNGFRWEWIPDGAIIWVYTRGKLRYMYCDI